MKVADVMSKLVIPVAPKTTVDAALRTLLDNNISGLPVIDEEGRLVGIVTERDFLRWVEIDTARHRAPWLELLLSPGRLAEEHVRSHARHVDEMMTRDLVTVDADAVLSEVVEKMERHKIKRILVLDGQNVVGIVSRRDLLRALLAAIPERPRPGSDAAIRNQILAQIDCRTWAPRTSVNVAVSNGVVEFSGVVFDACEREALRLLAENVPAVREVQDRLASSESTSSLTLEAPEERACD